MVTLISSDDSRIVRTTVPDITTGWGEIETIVIKGGSSEVKRTAVRLKREELEAILLAWKK